jgi:hypothetical protein
VNCFTSHTDLILRETAFGLAFDPVAARSQLDTLEDVGTWITKLPKSEHTAPESQAAMEALIQVMTLGGPTMFARIGVIRALDRRVDRVFNPDRKDTHWGKRKFKRDEQPFPHSFVDEVVVGVSVTSFFPKTGNFFPNTGDLVLIAFQSKNS